MESTLNAFAAGDFANDEVGVDAAVALGNDHAFKGLHTFASSLDHVDADHHGVARGENRDFLAHTGDFFLFQGLDEIHGVLTMIMDALHKRPMVLKTRGGHPEDRKPAIITGWLSHGLMRQELLIRAGQKPRLTGFF